MRESELLPSGCAWLFDTIGYLSQIITDPQYYQK